MARKETVTCDVCGAERKEVNHWFVLAFSPEHGSVSVFPWDRATYYIKDGKHVCGQACAHKLLDEFLSK
jgi:hypothetical protein